MLLALSFLRPSLLLLLLLVPVLWFWPRRAPNRMHAALRSLVMLLVIFAIAAPVRLRQDDRQHQVFIVDMSSSIQARSREALQSTLAALLTRVEANDTVHLLTIGGDGEDFGELLSRFSSVQRVGSNEDSQSIQESSLSTALMLAALTIPEGSKGAVILLSDGLATDRRWSLAMESLTAAGIPLHTLELPSEPNDVRPVALLAAGSFRVGQTARLFVDVLGPVADVRLLLESEAGKLAESEVLRLEGRRRVVLEFEPKKPGFVSYTVTVHVVAGEDRFSSNNKISGMFAVQDPIRVLYLGKRVEGAAQELSTLLGPGFEIDPMDPLSEAAGDDIGKVLGEKLDSHDLVHLDDLPAKDLSRALQRQIVAAVTDRGLGMFMSGGGGSFGPGGYHKTPVESILPVELVQKEEKKDPSTALAIIIDTSGSMGGNRIRLAKEVTRLALRRLLPHDKVGIVEFYGNKHWAAPLQSAANAIDIQRALNRLNAGGGTILFPAIEEAYYGLRNVRTRYKHVLVLTDAGVESGPYEDLLRRMSKDGINVSTVLVGPGRHSEFLVELADWGRGRFYNASDRFNLPEIMLKQPSSARMPGYRIGVQTLEASGGVGWWGESDPSAVPAISGYVETRQRPGADVILRTQKEKHPILASWRFGLGRVTVLTTEPTGPGTKGWQSWDGYGAFLARVLSRTAVPNRLPFHFGLLRKDHELVLTAKRLERSHVLPKAKLLATGDLADVELRFRERAPGLFEARFMRPPAVAAKVLAGVAGASRGSFRLVSRAREDVADELQVDPDQGLDLALAARVSGGQYLTPQDSSKFTASTGGGNRSLAVHELWPVCLLLALLLYLGDLFLRRSSAKTVVMA